MNSLNLPTTGSYLLNRRPWWLLRNNHCSQTLEQWPLCNDHPGSWLNKYDPAFLCKWETYKWNISLGMTEDEKMQLAAKKMQEKFQAEAEGKSVSFLFLIFY